MSDIINWPTPASEGMIYTSDNGDKWIYEKGGWNSIGVLFPEGFGATASTNCLNITGTNEGDSGTARNNQWYYGNPKNGWANNQWSDDSLGSTPPSAGELVLNYTPALIYEATKIPVAYHDWDSVTETSKDFLRICVVGYLTPTEGTLTTGYKFYGATLGTTCGNLDGIPLKGAGDLRTCEDVDGTSFNANGTLCYYYDCPLDNFLTPAVEPFNVTWDKLKPYNNILFGAWKIKFQGEEAPIDFGTFRWSYRIDYISAKGGKPSQFA